METKKCNKCGEVKQLSEFSTDKRNSCGRIGHCKKCSSIITKKWKDNNIEKAKESDKKYKIKNKLKISEYYINQRKYIDINYAKRMLRQSGFTTEQINENPELIEVKRLIVKTKRLCKTLQNSEEV